MNLHVDLGIDRLNKHHEELCGDNVEVVRNGDSTIVVLADGLGSGVKANILSKLTAKILATLMTNGFPMEEAVETIVDTLPVCRERDIAYSTFSILQLHHDGSGYLAEFDNPAMFRLRKGRVLPLDSQTREISGKRIRESRFEVAPGDLFVLVSDG
jgi:serine phosphatase RsbU (regulator of sigma subunit)